MVRERAEIRGRLLPHCGAIAVEDGRSALLAPPCGLRGASDVWSCGGVRRRALRIVRPVGDEAMADAIGIAAERLGAAECKIALARIAHRPAAGARGKLKQPARRAEGLAGARMIEALPGRAHGPLEAERAERLLQPGATVGSPAAARAGRSE